MPRRQEAFEGLLGRIAGRFVRVGPRRRVRQLVLGLLSDLPRKNCRTLAEHAGDATPDGMRHLLHRAKWDADAIRDDVRAYVVEHDTEAVPVVDGTGDLKKGTATVGAQHQYTGTAGRIERLRVLAVHEVTRRRNRAGSSGVTGRMAPVSASSRIWSAPPRPGTSASPPGSGSPSCPAW